MAPDSTATAALELLDWRREVGRLYEQVRAEPNAAASHELWRRGRDSLFSGHPQSPLPAGDPLRASGLPCWPYDPELRFDGVPVEPAAPATLGIETVGDGRIPLRRVGVVRVPRLGVELDVWWLAQYAGGLFLPVRDGTAGTETYGGGRYLLDTAKGADLGGGPGSLTLDFNFLYHPSCRYDSAWECPLAPQGNRTPTPLRAGERL